MAVRAVFNPESQMTDSHRKKKEIASSSSSSRRGEKRDNGYLNKKTQLRELLSIRLRLELAVGSDCQWAEKVW